MADSWKGLASFGLADIFELGRVLLRSMGAFLSRCPVDVKKNFYLVTPLGNKTGTQELRAPLKRLPLCHLLHHVNEQPAVGFGHAHEEFSELHPVSQALIKPRTLSFRCRMRSWRTSPHKNWMVLPVGHRLEDGRAVNSLRRPSSTSQIDCNCMHSTSRLLSQI